MQERWQNLTKNNEFIFEVQGVSLNRGVHGLFYAFLKIKGELERNGCAERSDLE